MKIIISSPQQRCLYVPIYIVSSSPNFSGKIFKHQKFKGQYSEHPYAIYLDSSIVNSLLNLLPVALPPSFILSLSLSFCLSPSFYTHSYMYIHTIIILLNQSKVSYRHHDTSLLKYLSMYFLCRVIFLYNDSSIITPNEVNIDKIILSNMQSILRFP